MVFWFHLSHPLEPLIIILIYVYPDLSLMKDNKSSTFYIMGLPEVWYLGLYLLVCWECGIQFLM